MDGTSIHPPSGVVLVATNRELRAVCFFQPDGKLINVSTEKPLIRYKGRYYNGFIFSFYNHLGKRYSGKISICGKFSIEPIKGMEPFPHNDFNWFKILYIDQDALYFTATPNKHSRHKYTRSVVTYKLDRLNHKIKEIDLNYSGDGASAVPDKVYYSNPSYNIYVHKDGKDINTGLQGVEPSVSPDGRYLAFMGSSFFTFLKAIYLHDFQSGNTKLVTWNLISTFEKDIIWSPDSKYFGIRERSDISSPPLKLYKASTAKIDAEIDYIPFYFMISEDEYKKIRQECNYAQTQEANAD